MLAASLQVCESNTFHRYGSHEVGCVALLTPSHSILRKSVTGLCAYEQSALHDSILWKAVRVHLCENDRPRKIVTRGRCLFQCLDCQRLSDSASTKAHTADAVFLRRCGPQKDAAQR